MENREKVIGGLAACTGETNDCAGHTCPYWDFDDSVVDHGCRIQMELDALSLLKEQDELLRKKQKDIDRLCNEISEWKHKFHDKSLKEQEAVKPKTGHWIYRKYDDMFMCSSCEKYSIRNNYPYCHWCGAKMNQEGREVEMKEYIMRYENEVLQLLPDKIQPLVRCKDCKHRPKEPNWEQFESGCDIEFPDRKCPCQCSDDPYYSWYPGDDWFCAEGERKEGR